MCCLRKFEEKLEEIRKEEEFLKESVDGDQDIKAFGFSKWEKIKKNIWILLEHPELSFPAKVSSESVIYHASLSLQENEIK